MSPEPQPLAAAAERLRGKPGRPRRAGAPSPAVEMQAAARRLLDLEQTAIYLGDISPWTVRDLEAAGVLQRVRIPTRHGELRKILFDMHDLDRLIASWKERS